MKKWKTLSSKEMERAIVFKHFKYKRESQDSGKVGEFDVIKCLNWVNVVAFNKEGELILVKQYRHGIDELTVEIPGGAVDLGENFLVAAKRELQEETGYTSDNWKFIGEVHPNPAFISNLCQTFLATDCSQTHSQSLDELEEVEVLYAKKETIESMVKNGKITHSLVIAAFYFAQINN